MAEVVEETMEAFQSDFYKYDKATIMFEGFKFPFIWIVGKSHTHMMKLGNYKEIFFQCENIRYDYQRCHNPWSYFLTESYYAKDKWFFVSEEGLREIDRNQAKNIIMDYVNPVVEQWKAENGPLPKLTKIPIKLNGISNDSLKALIYDGHAHGDDSLLQCLKARRTPRVAKDHYVEITYDSGWNEFWFSEQVNGQTRICGAIKFHGWPETGYMTNGSIQIDPHYGWSSHT